VFNAVRQTNNFIMEERVMKKMIPLLTVTALLIAGFALVCDVQAQFWKGRGGKGQGAGTGFGPNCPLGVNLTQDQLARMDTLRNDFFKDTATIRTDMYRKQLDLESLMLEPSVDAEKAGKLQAELSALESQIEQKQLQFQLEARKLLTPEQIAQLPPGCNFGMGFCGRGNGPGAGRGFRGGRGQGYGCGMGNW
jgi:zinc resistance-associated protein